MLESASPQRVSRAGGATLTLHGQGFVPGMTVEIGGSLVPASQVALVAADTLLVTAPALRNRCGLLPITLHTPAGGAVTRSGLLRYYLPHLQFSAAQHIKVASSAVNSFFVDLADMNRDGKQDIVLALNSPVDVTYSTLGVLLGNGDGTFAPVTTAVIGQSVFSFAIMDWDRDGALDILTGSIGGPVGLLRGTGSGGLTRVLPDIKPFAGGTTSVLGLDLGTSQPPTLLILGTALERLQNISGQVQHTLGQTIGPAGQLASAGDVNRDGLVDVVETYFQRDRAPELFLGQGAGTFAAGMPLPITGEFTSSAVGDLDGDGWPDILVASTSGNLFAVFINQRNGRFAAPKVYPISFCRVVQLADLNCDGSLDVILVNERMGRGTFLLNQGDGTFGTPQTITLPDQNISVAAADLNGDQAPDLVFAYVSTTIVSVVLNSGD